MVDNRKQDKYHYQILVFTGNRKNAGTASKVRQTHQFERLDKAASYANQVHFVVAGDDDETRVRTFSDPHRTILQRGGIDAFVMSVPKFVVHPIQSSECTAPSFHVDR